VERSPQATRQLASRARRRVRNADPLPDGGITGGQAVIDSYLAAARDGNFDTLIALRSPQGRPWGRRRAVAPEASVEVHGAKEVTGRALTFSRLDLRYRPVLVNGTPGLVCIRQGQPFSAIRFTVIAGRITAVDILADSDRLNRLELSALEEQRL
jgi:RNA polymerase sigma-70 factor (ECF subfamily)